MHLKFSQDLESLLKQLAAHPLTLKDILSETSERGFSLIIGFFVIPFLIPMPPGLAGVFGAACLLLSLQMALGRHEPWLPRKIANFKFPRGFSLTLLKQLKGLMRLLEKITRPRLLIVANNHYIWRINGLCMAWLAILLMLPVPLTNFLPSSGILLLAVATLEADGLLMCVGYIWTVLVTLLFAFIGYALFQAHELFR